MRNRIGNISQSISDDEWSLLEASEDSDELEGELYGELAGADDLEDLDEDHT